MADRLTSIEVFTRAIRLGGLSAASREMRMSPAIAAKHLNGLEERLGKRSGVLHRDDELDKLSREELKAELRRSRARLTIADSALLTHKALT